MTSQVMDAAAEHLANASRAYEIAQRAYDEIAATIPEAERNVAQCRWRIEQAAGAVLVENALGLPDELAAADRRAGRTKAAAVDYAEKLCRIAATSMGNVLHA